MDVVLLDTASLCFFNRTWILTEVMPPPKMSKLVRHSVHLTLNLSTGTAANHCLNSVIDSQASRKGHFPFRRMMQSSMASTRLLINEYLVLIYLKGLSSNTCPQQELKAEDNTTTSARDPVQLPVELEVPELVHSYTRTWSKVGQNDWRAALATAKLM